MLTVFYVKPQIFLGEMYVHAHILALMLSRYISVTHIADCTKMRKLRPQRNRTGLVHKNENLRIENNLQGLCRNITYIYFYVSRILNCSIFCNVTLNVFHMLVANPCKQYFKGALAKCFFAYAEFIKTHPHQRDLEELPLRLHATSSHPLEGKYFVTLLHLEIFEVK